jgi:hypothetical protein
LRKTTPTTTKRAAKHPHQTLNPNRGKAASPLDSPI